MKYRRYSTDGRPQPIAEAEEFSDLISEDEVYTEWYTDDQDRKVWEIWSRSELEGRYDGPDDPAAMDADDLIEAVYPDGDPYAEYIREEED